ncbi:MAG TPA: septation protein SepH [Mycobacteriales bacterium]|nr:septation protein SepH [Mycobacteriales bacterium]
MRELHVVALSSDGKHLVVTPNKGSLKGAYLLPVNARLRKALNGELNPKPKPAPEPEPEAAPPPPKPAVESRLSPREIQARLRAGQAPERVARAAGVPLDRVMRFSGPVLSERAQVIDAAREATLTRARLGASKAPLGASVAANLAAKGATAAAEDWTAFRRPDGSWTVRVTVAGSRGRPRRAEWTWQPATKTLTAGDAYAAALGHVDRPIARKRPAARPAR